MANKTYHPRGKLIDGFKARHHPNYSVWAGIKARCSNPNNPSFTNYGYRGISYCYEWEHFENFCRDMGVRPSKAHSIERVDNEKGYSKENCVWATRHEQSLNRRKFKNNTSGERGVKAIRNGRYITVVSFKGVLYKAPGSFETVADASEAYQLMLCQLQDGVKPDCERKARFDSSTGHRGITRHPDGGFMVRKTIGGCRKYLGYFKDIELARRAYDEN